MPKYSLSKEALPPEVVRTLQDIGQGLQIARKRRKESQTDFACRLMISRTTLTRMEAGDPTVSFAAWITAAWLLGRLEALKEVFDPDNDSVGKQLERQAAHPRRGGGGLDNDF